MLERRPFLRGLAALPLIGGSVQLVGRPTAAAVPVTKELLHSYKSWLYMEHRMIYFELSEHDLKKSDNIERFHLVNNNGANWHLQWSRTPGFRGPAGWIDAPQPSTRAAVVLSAVGCPLEEDAA